MNWTPAATISPQSLNRSYKLIIADGLCSEVMTTLSSGTFLIAMVLLLDASNFQIGLLAGLPTFTNIFQLASIWLIRRFNNRKIIALVCTTLARLPLVVLGLLLLAFPNVTVETVIGILFINYLFGSISGPCWNVWMKDLIPESQLGTFFSRRSSFTQMLNAVLGISAALVADHVKNHYPGMTLHWYAIFFIIAGAVGLCSTFFLANTPEPTSQFTNDNLFRTLQQPLRDNNFKRLLIFNSVWVFAVNMATPFFVVFMMKDQQLSIVYVMGLTVISQLCSISTVRLWGRSSDRYSNKTIIAICGPIYILCLIAWCFVGIFTQPLANLALLLVIHIATGVANAGITLSLTNISLKLSPTSLSIVYLSTKNIITAFFSFAAALLGGYLADYFTRRSLSVNFNWAGPKGSHSYHLVDLHEWNFLFLIAAGLAIIAIELLAAVKEKGEVEKDEVVKMMRSNIKTNLKDYFIIGQLIHLHENLKERIRRRSLL